MPVRVETDTVIYVPALEPGTEDRRGLQIRFPLHGSGVILDCGKYGRQVEIAELRGALDQAERLQLGADQ